MKKILSLFTSAILSVTLMMGCGSKQGQDKVTDTKQEITVNLVVPDGLPAVAVSKIIKEDNKIDNVVINSSIEKTSDTLATSVLKGEPDIAIVPSNLAAQAYNKDIGYKILGTVGWGSLFLVSSDPEVNNLSELKGKEIYNIGKGLTPDIAFKGVLTNNNIDPDKDVNISYVGGASEVPSLILSGKAKIAVVPEPMLSTVLSKKSDLKVICNINDEWKKILGSDDGYPQSTLIVKDDLLENSEEFINEFNKLISKDIDFVNTNREEAGKMCEELGISVAAPILVKALDNANLKYKNISETKDAYNNYYKKLNEYEPKLIGGKVPDEKIFAK